MFNGVHYQKEGGLMGKSYWSSIYVYLLHFNEMAVMLTIKYVFLLFYGVLPKFRPVW